MNKKDNIATSTTKRRIIPLLITASAWIGMVLFWYLVLALAVDMPKEHKLRHSTDKMRAEYQALAARYDSLSMVMDNVISRDENVFRKLFEANPYDLTTSYTNSRYELLKELVSKNNRELSHILNQRRRNAEQLAEKMYRSTEDLNYVISTNTLSAECIPSIQPVNNQQLTLLAAGKKQLINPFHRTMREHHGVDYLVPEGTAVFATADGRVKSLSEKNSSHGKAVIIDHGNGYETSYSHLLDIRVRVGDMVKRGDIIALSGNSGLSFAPHLHYEVIYNDMRVDPIHYFFMELTPEQYQRIIGISLSSMQSFD